MITQARTFALMLFAVMLGAAKCPPEPLPPPGPDIGGSGEWPEWDQPSAGTGGARPAPVGADDCEKAEDYAFKMGCPLKKPKRASWAEACRNGRANGVDMQDDCVLGARDCGGIHYCVENSAP